MSNVSLKEALYENLLNILSSDTNVRTNAEAQIKVFEVTNNYGLDLTEIALDANIQWPIRQLSSVLLKQFIDTHWSTNKEKFEEPEVPAEVKVSIRHLLITALGGPSQSNLAEKSPEKKLRSSIAYAISAIAYSDWPEEWPELFPTLVNYLTSGNYAAIYGAMKVFSEVCHEIVDSQIPAVAPLLLPKMYEIFVNVENFSVGTRERAVQIFSIISETITLMGDFDKNAVKMYLDPVLPQFTEALLKTLQLPDSSNQVDIALKKSVLNALTILIKNCRKRMWRYMPAILSPVWRILTTSSALYVKAVVNTEASGVDDDAQVDSDGEVLSLEGLILAVFDFITVLIETPKSRQLIKPGIRDLIYYVIMYMQITDEQMAAWTSNPDQFVEDEDEDSYSYSVRISALDILISLSREFEENESKEENQEFRAALITAIKKHFEESGQQRHDYYWWKPQEACLLALGTLSQTLIETVEDHQSPLSYELKSILDHVFSSREEVSVFYSGRSLWTAGRYAPIMQPHVIQNFLQGTAQGLMNQSAIMQISALRSTYNFCVHLQETNQIQLITPYLPQILDSTIRIGTQFETEVLSLVLETVSKLLSVDPNFTYTVCEKVCNLGLDTFLNRSSDPVLVEFTEDIFKELAKNERCFKITEQKLIPTIAAVLNPRDQETSVLKPVALDILTTVVRCSPLPLSQELISQCFPATCNTILSTVDDNSIMQNGGESVRAFVSKSPEQLARFNDPQSGRDGMTMVMQVCLHLLDPRVNESCAAFVGKLIFITINKGSSYLGNDNIHLLLRSVLSKLQTSNTLSVVQSLIMVFAHLVNADLPTVLDFLSSLPGPSGQSALEFVLIQWLSKQHLFYGLYENKVTVYALCKLLEYSVSASPHDNRLNLNRILVPGEPIQGESSGIKTRAKSRAKPDQWTMIPCSVKILKLLLHELNHIEHGDTFDCDYEDSDDDDSDDENGGSGAPFGGDNFGSGAHYDAEHVNMLDDGDDENDDSDSEDDQDILGDPISKLNLKQHLTNFLQQFMKTPFAQEFSSQITEIERSILKSASDSH